MVYRAQAMPGYAFALTTFSAGDQQVLPSNASLVRYVQAGQLLFFTFVTGADVSAFNVSLLTNNDDGNADLFLSSTNPHPYAGTAGGAQWSSYADPSLTDIYTESVAANGADAGWQAGGGRYYLSVFGQRATSFTLQLTLVGPPPPQPEPTGNSSSSSSTGLTVALAVLLPLVGLLLLGLFIQRRRLWKSNATLGGDAASASSEEAEPSVVEPTGDVDVQMTPRGWRRAQEAGGAGPWTE